MSTIRTILVDDEPLALRGLKIRLEPYEDIEIVQTCSNGREAIKAVKEQKPDLVFLDIQMPGFDGFAVIKSLVVDQMPIVIFCTAYDQYALDAFEAHALDYLLKPVDEQRLKEAIHRVRDAIAQRTAVEQTAKIVDLIDKMDPDAKEAITAILEDSGGSGDDLYERQLHIRDRGHITRVDVPDIEFIDAAGDYMCIHVGDRTHILRETMKVMERKLDPKIFQRIHRSTIVNLDKVREVHPHANGECFLTLENGKELKVSRSYKSVVARFM